VSLDVYLRIPGAPPRVSSGIFVRENGATHELTRDEWDLRYPGREPAVANITDCESDTSVLDANITHNLGTCGSKYPHEAHEWQQMGRPTGPLFRCPGKIGRVSGGGEQK
jgi:hypothetical protein